MKSLRILGVLLGAVFAFGVVGVSVAAASPPEFSPATPQPFLFTSATSVLRAGPQVVTCATDRGTGQITGTDTVANVHITFLGCSITTGGGLCQVNSPGGLPGLIDTVTLKGNLGTVPVSQAASLVGLLLEPTSGSTYATLAATGSPCNSVETAVTGKIAGEVTPVGKKQLTGIITAAISGGKNKIKEINVLNKGFVEVPPLKAFGVAATEETVENINFAKEIEVT